MEYTMTLSDLKYTHSSRMRFAAKDTRHNNYDSGCNQIRVEVRQT